MNHWFGAHHALRDIALTIAAGQYVAHFSPSGCGKTSLMSVVGGLVTPDQGRVLIAGQDVTGLTPAQRPITTVFQHYALFPRLTLRDNVGFGMRMAGIARAESHRRAEAPLALFGLTGTAGRRPHELSGGHFRSGVRCRDGTFHGGGKGSRRSLARLLCRRFEN